MPGNEVEDRTHNLYRQDNSSQGQHQFQAVEDTWPVVNYNQWVGAQWKTGAALSFNLKDCNVQQLDSVKGHGGESLCVFSNQNYGQLTPRSEFSDIFSKNQHQNSNGDMLGRQKFQQENVSGDSPTLTTNSERSEITEASIDFDFVGLKQQLFWGQQLDTPQSSLMQQSGYNDVQLLQQHIVFKQLQELQRQQQLQHLGDSRQQNSALTKQATGAQISPVINGTPVNDASHMFMNWMQRSTSPAVQGIPNRVVISQDQAQALHPSGLASQQLDVSLYGTPVASAKGSMSPYSHLQGVSHDSANLLTKVGVKAQKPVMQSSGFSNPFLGDQVTVSSEQVSFPQEPFMSKQRFQRNNVFGLVPVQGMNSGGISGNLQLGSTLQKNASLREFNGRQERAGWPGTVQQKDMQIGPSQGLVPLDPMEEKILYNMDDSIWDASFGRRTDMASGGFGTALEHVDYSSAFPSTQSGSWSALMQSAVAEASSSDTGLQEEWSGLTFQNTDLSTDNQPSNVMDSEKQQSNWVDNKIMCTSSLTSNSFPVFNDSSVSSSFPGFHQPGVQFSMDQRDAMHHDDSHESIHKSSKNIGEWLDCHPQHKQSTGGSQLVQPLMHLDCAWAGQIFEHPESDAHEQRISSGNNVSQPCSELKDDVNEAMYKRRVSDDCLWDADSNCGVSSFSRSTGGLDQVHSGTDSTLPNREDSQIFSFAAVPNSSPSKACRETGQQVQLTNQLDFIKHVDKPRNKENQSMGKNRHQMNNGSHVLHNYHVGAGGTYEMQQNCYQKDSYDNYCSKGLSGQEQHVGQLKFIGNVSSCAMNLDKGHLPEFQVNSNPSEMASGGDIDKSSTFHQAVHPQHIDVNAQTSENMLELLHKVDQSEENSSLPLFGSRGCDSLVSKTEAPDASVAQLFHQSAASQGFTLKLAPPSQRLSNMNPFISSQHFPEVGSNVSSRKTNCELGAEDQTWLASPSVHSLPPSHGPPQRSHWDNKLSSLGQTSIPSSVYIPGSCAGAFTSNPPYLRNKLQMQNMSDAPLASPSSLATLPGTFSRYSPLNLAPSEDTSPRVCADSSGQQLQVLEAKPVLQPPIMSGMHQQGSFSVGLHNAWTNVPIQQRLAGVEPHKVPSMDASTNSVETSLASQGLNDQNSLKIGYGSSEFSTFPVISQGFEYGVGQREKERSQLQLPFETVHVSQTSSLPGNISDSNAFASGSLLGRSQHHGLDRIQHEDSNAPASFQRNLGSTGHSLKPSHVFHPNYPTLPQVQATKNVDTDPSRRVSDVQDVTAIDGTQLIYEHNSRFRNQMDTGLMSAPGLNSLRDSKMQSFVTEAREDFGIKALLQPAALDRPSEESVASGQNDFTGRSTTSNVVFNQAEHPEVNLHMAPSWFNRYEALRNGQIPQNYDARLVRTASGQFSLGKPSQNLNILSSVERVGFADASKRGRQWPISEASLVASEPFSIPYLLPLDDIDQCMAIVKPKKRKTATSDFLPWHKEVTQGSQRVQNISVAEDDWAQATNRLVEKVEDEAELIEDRHSMPRSKRRLMLTRQLMQQLLCPPPMSILSAKAASEYDILAYFVAKLSLGDACSLTSCTRNGLLRMSLINNNLISEKLKAFEGVEDQFFSEVVEAFSTRAKKLEIDLLRLDKVASILDIRVECQELEKFSVINRFAKFHVRQADSSGTSSSSGTATPSSKPFPLRYVVAHPIPRNLPEGVQCLSL